MDRYRKKLQHAAWTWREEKVSHAVHGPSRHKDRRDGRNDKRSAKQEDRKEIEQDEALPRNQPCEECGEPECPGARN
jgi:hypothetical protein